MLNAEMSLVGSWRNKPVPKVPCLILATGEGQGGKCSGEREVRWEKEVE